MNQPANLTTKPRKGGGTRIATETCEAPSPAWQRMVYQGRLDDQIDQGEIWANARYYANVKRYPSGGPGEGMVLLAGAPLVPYDPKPVPWARIGITAMDETARHDWREFQCIKNDVVGDEWEAVEFYPAESRLADPSNRFYLIAFPKGALVIPGLIPERRVLQPAEALAPQRPWAHGRCDLRTGVAEVPPQPPMPLPRGGLMGSGPSIIERMRGDR